MSWFTDLFSGTSTGVTKTDFDALSARVAKLEKTPSVSPGSVIVCDRYGVVDAGSMFIQNNKWNDAGGNQCITVDTTGTFKITTADHNVPQNGAPAAYPSIVYGYHYGRASKGTVLPRKMSDIKTLTSTVVVTYPKDDSVYDCAYDIWLDSTPKLTGQNEIEIMIWLNHTGTVQPVGSKVNFAGPFAAQWDLWKGNIGWDVYSFVSKGGTSAGTFDLKQFIFADIGDKYLTSVQFGFEPWVKGVGLSIDQYSLEIT